MKNKNILFLVVSMNRGGAERVVSILLNHLSKKDNVKLHLIMIRKGIGYQLPSSIKPILIFPKDNNSIIKFLKIPLVVFYVAKYVKKHKIDTIVSFMYRPNYINILTKFFGFKGKSILNIRSTTSRFLKEGITGKINLFLIKSLFNKAELIISNSNGVKDDLERLITIKTKHIAIPNPVDIKQIQRLKVQPCPIKLDKNSKYIISVGRLIPLKRNKDLILAFSKIHKKIPEYKLLFLGEGELETELKKLAKNLGIENKIIFGGNIKNPFSCLSKSELFVMTSELEGFPNVLVEAMACGLPVISSNCKSGPSEILGNNKYGLLYEVGDIDDLSKKILLVLSNNDLKTKLSKLAFDRVKYYDLNNIINKFEKEILE